MKDNNIDELIRPYITQIANIITTNVQRLDCSGIIYGHMGVVLFLYHYANYIKNSQYEENADKLFGYIVEKQMRKMGHRFFDGLYGLGWSVKYLGQHSFVKVAEDALADYDNLLKDPYTKAEHVYEMDCEVPLFSRALYCYDMRNHKSVNETLLLIYGLLKTRQEETLELCFLNSITYFVIRCSQNRILNECTQKIWPILKKSIENSIFKGKYTKADIYILVNFQNKGLDKIDIPCVEFDNLRDIFSNWQTIVYYDIIELGNLPSPISLSSFISKINENINLEMLSLGGLSSLGINLIKKVKELN